MAIDVFTERVVTLREAIALLPNGPHNKKLHVSTLYRWCFGGLRSSDDEVVRLEIVKIGGTTCTSQEALQRFFDRLSGKTAVVTPPTPHERKRLREIEMAEEILRKAGI